MAFAGFGGGFGGNQAGFGFGAAPAVPAPAVAPAFGAPAFGAPQTDPSKMFGAPQAAPAFGGGALGASAPAFGAFGASAPAFGAAPSFGFGNANAFGRKSLQSPCLELGTITL